MQHQLLCCLDKYKDKLEYKRFAVAVSGGIDSLSLLLVSNEWAKLNNASVVGITVDHCLRKESRNEATYVNNLCKKFGINHEILIWEGNKPENNIELIARENRYRLISNFCKHSNIDFLLVAHHLEDQAETFFIRLFRGSGIDGLSSIQEISNIFDLKIIRPFLGIHKETLKNYLLEKNIKWVEDLSNIDEKFLRNKIRNFINTFENKEEIVERINFAINEINKSKKFIQNEVEKLESKILNFTNFGSCLINKNVLLKQDEDIILRFLAKASMKISGNVYKPRLEKLKRLYNEITVNNIIKYTFYGCVFQNYGDSHIMVYREYNSISEDIKLRFNEEVIWDNRFKVLLKEDLKNNIFITHLENGKFNELLEQVRNENFDKYKEIKQIKGIEKNIFYTLPLVKIDEKYIIDYNKVDITKI